MNKHIQSLADQAKKSVPHGLTPDKWIEVYNEKFAELVVRDCADFVQFYYKDHACEVIAHDMKTHFGVKS
jgi:hypothetical protein